jgi:hypothetical protein
MNGAPAAGAFPVSAVVTRSRALEMWIARTALYVAAAASVGARAGGDPAFMRSLANGRALLAGRGAFDRLDCLPSVLYAAVERISGFEGIAALGALCAILMLALVEAQARARGASAAWALAAAGGAAALSLGTLRADGGAFGWMLGAAFMFSLASTAPWRLVAAVLLAWAWASSSWIGIAAPLIAAAAAIGRRGDRTLLWIAAGSALATFATPAGLALPREALAHLTLDGARATALVWQPADVSGPAYRFGLLPLVIALVWFRLPRLADWPAVAIALTLAFACGTAMPLAGITILPCLVPAAASRRAAALSWSSLALAIPCALVAPLIFSVQPTGGGASALPLAVVGRLSTERSGRTVLCAPAEWCALVESLGRRDIRAFASDRIGRLDERQALDQIAISRARPLWRQTAARNEIDAILVANDRALETLLDLQPDWRAVARDESASLFIRSVPARR